MTDVEVLAFLSLKIQAGKLTVILFGCFVPPRLGRTFSAERSPQRIRNNLADEKIDTPALPVPAFCPPSLPPRGLPLPN